MKQIIIFIFFTLSINHFASAQVVTEFGEGAGEYKELFDNLKTRLLNSEHVTTVKLGGKERNVFVRWVRDNVHVMKAMKYFSPEISSFWQLYMETQTPEGLYFDYYYPIEERVNHRMNLFDKRYWRIFLPILFKCTGYPWRPTSNTSWWKGHITSGRRQATINTSTVTFNNWKRECIMR